MADQVPRTEVDTLHVNLDGSLIDSTVRNVRKLLPAEFLGKEIDDDPVHVTIKWGIYPGQLDLVKQACLIERSVQITAGSLSLFQNPDFDVLKVDISSDELRLLRNRVDDSVAYMPSIHKDYHPHATVAYLRRGTGPEALSAITRAIKRSGVNPEGLRYCTSFLELSGAMGNAWPVRTYTLRSPAI